MRTHEEIVDLARQEALRLVGDVRDVDPRANQRHIYALMKTDPELLAAAVITLAAAIPEDRSLGDLLNWTEMLHVKPVIHRSSTGIPQTAPVSFDQTRCA